MFNRQRINDLEREIKWLTRMRTDMAKEILQLSQHVYSLAEKLGYHIEFYPRQEVWEKIEKE